MKKLLIALMALMLLVPAAALAETGVSKTEVTIGFSTPLSGPAALWGVTALGAKAWADYVNSQGGVNGRKIKCIIKDDGYNPARTLANLKQMQNQIFAVVGLLGSAPVTAAKDFFPKNKIPSVSAMANVRIPTKLPKKDQKWFFVAYPDYADETHYQTKYAVEKLGSKKIAHFYQNDDFGHLAQVGIVKALKELGGKAKLIAKVPYEVTERSLSAHALKLKESGADMVIITASPVHTAIIVKTMAKVGYKPKMMNNFTVADPIMHKLIGAAWEGSYITMPGTISMPGFDKEADEVVKILIKFEPKIKGKEYLGLFGAAAMMHMVEGLKNAGKTLTRETLIKGMEKIKNFKPMGMGAPSTYGPNIHHGNNAVRMTKARKDGKNEPIGDYVVFKPIF